jgi:MATE family multidrug resistance protein
MINNPQQFKLSRFSSGGVKEVLHIALPLILAALSANLMMFIDRFILARYSLDAMNAVSIAATTISTLQFALIAIASIAEVFVGQNNGAGLYRRIAEPSWQMLWLALASFIVFIPLALFTGPLILPSVYLDLGLPFYQLITVFVPIGAMIAAVAAFFTGQGKTRLVMYTTILANIINLVLDIILIFGVPNILPAMGTLGAAIATVIAELTQLALLLAVFLNSKNRKYFNTADFHLNLIVLRRCIRVGAPTAIGHMFELLAWSVLLIMMAKVDQTHITIVAIGSNIYVLFAFITDGLGKSITAICANYIGADQWHMMKKVLHSGLIALGIVIGLIAIPLLIFPQFIINFFLTAPTKTLNYENLQHLLYVAMFGIWLFFLFDGIVWTIVGVLTAAGDTFFVMLISSSTVWIFSILPLYLLTKFHLLSAQWIWFIIALYSMLNAIIFFNRYHFGKWRKHNQLISRTRA